MATRVKKVICFDLDGTILDSARAHAESFKMAFKKNNLPYRSSGEIISNLGPPAEIIVKKLHPRISKRKLEQTVKDKNEFLLKKTATLAKPIPGVVEALKELKKYYKLALISNSIHEEIVKLLKAAKIPPRLFDVILGKGEMDHKPSKEVVKNVEKLARAKVEYFVGDTTFDIKTGKAAGVKTIAVLSGIHDIKQLGDEDPTMIIESVAVLPEILLGRL